MSIDPKSHITIEEAKDNYDTLFVVTKDQAGSRRWGLPASGGYAAAELAQPSA